MVDIRFEHVTVSYGNVIAIEDISFDIKKNDFIGIIGPNGGGKSTLVKAILNLVDIKSGSIFVAEGRKLSYVPQYAKFDRTFPISVYDVVLSGMIENKSVFFKKYHKTDYEKADQIITRLGIDNVKHNQIGELSGGQLQKVLIARALVTSPDILILDEPTSNLDVKVKKEIYSILKDINKNTTILLISHDLAEIMSYVDNIIYINKVIHSHDNLEADFIFEEECPIEELIEKEEELKKDFIRGEHNDRSSN